jgi:hypothetical protein
MKQTAVEWLHTKLSTCTSEELVGNINNWFEQAKEMEKEIIDDAYLCGLNRGVEFQQSQEMGAICEWPSDRDYYNETFNTEEK